MTPNPNLNQLHVPLSSNDAQPQARLGDRAVDGNPPVQEQAPGGRRHVQNVKKARLHEMSRRRLSPLAPA